MVQKTTTFFSKKFKVKQMLNSIVSVTEILKKVREWK